MANNIFKFTEEGLNTLKKGGVTAQDKKKVDEWLSNGKKTTTPGKPITESGPIKDTIVVGSNLEADRLKAELVKKTAENSTNIFQSAFEPTKENLPGIKVESQYANKSFAELTKLREMADNDEREGYITREDAIKIRDEIDLYRAQNGTPEELKSFLDDTYKKRDDAKEMKDAATAGMNQYSRTATPEGMAKTKEFSSLINISAKRESFFNDVIAIAEDTMRREKANTQKENSRYAYGKYALDNDATDSQYYPTDMGVEKYDVINRYMNKGITDDIYGFMTDEELKLYNALYNGGYKEKADKYFASIENDLKIRMSDFQTKRAKEYGEKHPYIAGAGTVVRNVVGGIPATVDNLFDLIGSGEYDTYDATSRFMRESQAAIQGGSEYMRNNYGEAGANAYNIGISLAENLTRYAVGGLVGKIAGAAGASSAVATNAAKNSMRAILVSNIAANTIIDVADRGGTTQQQTLAAAASALTELFFENISIEKLFNAKTAGTVAKDYKGYVANLFKNIPRVGGQIVTEGSEEFFTSVANLGLDNIIMMGKSESAIKRQEYIKQGMSPEEASRKVFYDNMSSLALDTLGGMVSGGVMGGVNLAVQDVSHTKYMTEVGEKMKKDPIVLRGIVELGIKNENAEAKAIIEKMKSDSDINGKEIGRMIESVVSDSITKDGGMMNIMNNLTTIEGLDASYAGSQMVFDTAKAIVHFVQGNATEADNAMLSRSGGAVTLLSSIEGNNKAINSIKNTAAKQLRESVPAVTSDVKYKTSETISDSDVYSHGKKISIPENAKMSNGIVISEESEKFRKSNSDGYKMTETLAKDLNLPVVYVDDLVDSKGQTLNGVKTSKGIFINTNAKDISRLVVTHEFSHRIKDIAPKAWAKYQSYVIEREKVSGKYYAAYELKKYAYNEEGFTREQLTSVIDEEIAADYIGEMFADQKELQAFIEANRSEAVAIRDIYYGILDKLGLLDEKKKAQLLWRKAYREAMQNRDVESEGGSKRSDTGTRENAREEERITVDMDEDKRAEVLKKASLNVVEAKPDALKLTLEEIEILESKCKSKAQSVMEDLCEKFGVVKEGYTNKNIELEFNYSNSSLRGSMHKQNERNPDFKDFAKMLTVFDSVVENAVPIESHTDKYKGTKRENPNLKQSYVLLSAFKSGEDIVPVELNIKEFKIGTKNKLYMSVTLKKIRADILAALPNNSSENATPSTLNISIAEIIKNVNPSDGDFLRYVPDEMLNEEQIKSKREAEEKERLKIESLKNEDTRKESSDKKSISGTRLSEYEGGELPFRPSSETGWLSQQWIAERSKDNEAMAQPLAEISKIVTEELKIPVTRRKFADEGVSGSYNLTSEAIHMRAANDIVTLSHEVGHHLDKILEMQKLDGFEKVVENFDKTLATLGYRDDAKKTEAVGEFIRMYLTNKDVAKTFAPEYYEAFENALEEKGYDKSIGRLADAVNAYLSSSISERLDLAISETDGRGKLQKLKEDGIRKELEEKKTKFSEFWENIEQDYIDSFYAIGKAQTRLQVENAEGKQDAHLLATNSLNAAARSAYILTKSFTNVDGEEIGMSFIDCITPIYNNDRRKKKENISDLNRYLVLKHALEWIEPKTKDVKKKRVFSDERLENPDVLRQEIAKIEGRLPEVKQAAENIYQYLRNLKKYWGVDMGIMTNDLSTKLDEMYPNYVPFFRESEKKGISGARVNLANQKAPILEASGGTELIVNPLESIVRLTEKYVKTASRNMSMQALANMADSVEGSGFIIERVSEAKKKDLPKDDKLYQNENNQAKATPDELKKITTEEDVWTKEFINGMGYVSVLIDGEKVWYQINDERLFKAVADMTPRQLWDISRAFAPLMQLKRALITSNNPLFATTNAVRDAITAYNNSDINNPIEYLGAYFTAFKHVLQRDPNYERWCAMGGGHSSEISANMNSVNRALSKAMQTSTINKVMYSVSQPIEFVASINDIVESTPRLMAFEQEMKKTGDVHRAINKADDITTNFKRGGQKAKNLNNLFIFSNAQIQGLDRTRRSFTKSDVEHGVRNRVIKYAVGAVLVAALLAWWNRRDEETEEDYKNLSKYMKRSQYVLSIGDGKFLRIPTAREQDLLRVIISDAIDMAFGDKESFDGLLGFVADAFIPPYIELPTNTKGRTMTDIIIEMSANTFRNTPIGTFTDLLANKNFTGTNVIPENLQDELPENQYNEKTSKLAVFLGKILKDSPMKIDYIINNNLGILGTLNKSLFPMDSTQVDKSMGFKTRWIADSYYSTDVLNKVYENRDAAEIDFKRNETGANAAEFEKNNAAATFITQYNKAIKELPDPEKREARKQLLTIINGWGNGESSSNDELIRMFDETKENLFMKMPTLEVSTESGKRKMTANEYVECVEKITAGFEASLKEVIGSEAYKNADNEKRIGMLEEASKYAVDTAKADTIPDFKMKAWEKLVVEGEETLENVISIRAEQNEYKDAEEKYLESIGYESSETFGDSVDRHVKVYDKYLKDKMDLDEYAKVRMTAKKKASQIDGKEAMSKDELQIYLEYTDYPLAIKAALFEAIGNKGWINPYTGSKIQ